MFGISNVICGLLQCKKGRILQCERRSIARRFTVNCNADFIFPHFTVICCIFQQTVGYAAVNQ